MNSGVGFASASAMEVSDRRPGKLPKIIAKPDTITVTFIIDSHDGRTIELVLRCERSGGLYANIATK